MILDCIRVYGEQVKGCKVTEAAHMTTFFNVLRLEHPDYAAIALHIRNEGKRTRQQMDREKLHGGFVKGASDIVIPGRPTFVCELKSQSKTAKLSPEQAAYLLAAHSAGAWCCVSYGYIGALQAFKDWLNINNA